MNLFLLLALLTAAPARAATETPCAPVEGAPGDEGIPSQPALIRWARSHLGTDAAGLIRALDREQLSWSGTEGRYLVPPPTPSGWRVRIAAPEPLQLTASFTLKPGACLTIRPYGTYGADGLSADDGALTLEGPWQVKLQLSVGGQTRQLLLTDIPALIVVWSREAGRRQARLITEPPAPSLSLDLPITGGTSESTWHTLMKPPASQVTQGLLLALLSQGDAPARQRRAAVTLLATAGQRLQGSAQSQLRDMLLRKQLAPREAEALDLVARAASEGSGAPALFTVEGDAPPRLWVDGKEVSGWAPHAKGFEVGTLLRGFLLVRAEWPDGESQEFWAALGPGVRLHLRTEYGPRQESTPQGERCITVEGTGARWTCGTELLPREGPLRCGAPASYQSAAALHSERPDGAEDSLVFVPSLPGRYTFRWHGPHIEGRWTPECGAVRRDAPSSRPTPRPP